MLDVAQVSLLKPAKDSGLDCIGIDLNPSAIEFGQKED